MFYVIGLAAVSGVVLVVIRRFVPITDLLGGSAAILPAIKSYCTGKDLSAIHFIQLNICLAWSD